MTSNSVIEGANRSGRGYFRTGRKRPFAGVVDEAVQLAKLVKRDRDETLPLVDFAAPVRNSAGALAAVIASHLDRD